MRCKQLSIRVCTGLLTLAIVSLECAGGETFREWRSGPGQGSGTERGAGVLCVKGASSPDPLVSSRGLTGVQGLGACSQNPLAAAGRFPGQPPGRAEPWWWGGEAGPEGPFFPLDLK